jgi:hypothetical protein
MILRRLSGRRGANGRRRRPRRQRSVSLAVARIHNRGEVGCFNFIFFEKQLICFLGVAALLMHSIQSWKQLRGASIGPDNARGSAK